MKRLRQTRSRSDKGAATAAELLVVAIAGAALSLVMTSVGGLIWDQRVDWRHAVEDASEQAMRLVGVSASHAEARAVCASPVPRYGEPEITLFSECYIVTREVGVFQPPSMGGIPTGWADNSRWNNSVCVQTSGTTTIGLAADASRRLECWWHEPGCPALRIVEIPSVDDPSVDETNDLAAKYNPMVMTTSVVKQANGCSTWICDNTLPAYQCPKIAGATGGQDAAIEEVVWECGDSECFPAVPDVLFIPINSVRMVLTAGCSAQADLDQCRDLATRKADADGLKPGEHLVRTSTLFLGQATNAVSDDADFIDPALAVQFGVDAEDDTIRPGTCKTHIWHFLHEFDYEAESGVEYRLDYLNADGTPASPSTVATPPTPISPTYTFAINNYNGNPPSTHWSGPANGTSLRLDHGDYILQARYRLEIDTLTGKPTSGTGTYGGWSTPNAFPFRCPNTWRSSGNMTG